MWRVVRAYRRTGPLVLAVVAVAGTVALSRELANRSREQLSRVIAAVSYSTRSELARRLDARQNALADLARLWAHLDETPSAEWESQVEIHRDLLRGVEFLAWSDPEGGVRRFTTPDDYDLGRRATELEWRSIGGALAEARRHRKASMGGPFRGEDGRVTYRVYVPARDRGGPAGTLVAQFSAAETLHDLLRDEAPGYAIRVFWDGQEIYRRQDAVPAPDLPDAWRQEGAIRLPFGALWRVRHEPTPALLADLAGDEAELVLVAGALISVLIGALAFEGQRARDRADAAHATEADVRRLNLELEDRVARRTAELEEAIADLDAFNSFVSHDLKSPLGAVLAFASILREDSADRLDTDGLYHLERIEAAARSGLSLTEGLLALSQVGRKGMRREPVDLTALVRETFEEVHLQAGGPAVELELDPGLRVQGDPGLLRTIFANLLGNALKFTRGVDGPRIEVGGARRDGELVVHVRDNGRGFDMHFGDRLFRPFERLHPDQAEGHGLGLAIVERAARRHGGRVWAEGRPGRGAVFYLSLPLGEAGAPPGRAEDARDLGLGKS